AAAAGALLGARRRSGAAAGTIRRLTWRSRHSSDGPIFKMTGARRAANFLRNLFRSLPMSPSSPALAELAPGISAAGRLDRADIDALAQAGIRTIINNRPDGEDPGQ